MKDQFLFIVIILATQLEQYIAQNFDQDYFGVVFSPLTKNWNYSNTQILPQTLRYTGPEIKIMLNKLSTQFKNILTFNMGVSAQNYKNDWMTIEGNGLVGRVSAELNKEKENLTISLLQGINLHPKVSIQEAEIENAFKSLNYSNEIFDRTIVGLIFLNDSHHVKSEFLEKGSQKATYFGVVNLIQKHKERAKLLGVKIGARVHNCEQIFSGPNSEDLISLAKLSDFILCVMEVDCKTATRGPVVAVQHIGKLYDKIKPRFLKENPNLEIMIGDFGWPSSGNSNNKAPSNPENLKIFWTEINKWAKERKVKAFLFEAFDEPWRSDHNSREDVPTGKLGALGHYGWWKRAKNNSDLYFDKLSKQNNDKEIKDTLWILIVGTVVPIVIVFAILIIYLIWRLKFFKKFINKLTNRDLEEFFNGLETRKDSQDNQYELATYMPYDKNYEIPKNKMLIDKNKILGSGAFGTVFLGRISGLEESFAFKTLKTSSTVENLKSLMAEIKIMSYLGKHKHIVSFIGAYTEELTEGIAYLIVELCSNGNLESFLRGENKQINSEYVNVNTKPQYSNKIGNKTNQEEMLKWALQIASGMAYLENKKVIHADLATRNILLTNYMDIKITDFGLSRRLYEYTSYVKKKQEPLPWRWMAIETLKTMHFSHASDVWAFGVTLWEIFSHGGLPYPGLGWNLFFVDQLEEGLTLPFPKYATKEIFDIMLTCWKLNFKTRPNFDQLFFSLGNVKIQENIL